MITIENEQKDYESIARWLIVDVDCCSQGGLYNHFAWETNKDGCDLRSEPAVRLWGGIWALVGLLLVPTVLMATAYSQLSLSLRSLPGDQRGQSHLIFRPLSPTTNNDLSLVSWRY